MVKKPNKDQKNSNSKKWIAISSVVGILVIGFVVNIVLACRSDSSANVFTAIAGWVGFLATAGVGIISMVQNKIIQQETDKKYRLSNLTQAKNYLNKVYQKLNKDNYDKLSLFYINKKLGKLTDELQFELEKTIILLELQDIKIDLRNFAYNFEVVIDIKKSIVDFFSDFRNMTFEQINEENCDRIAQKYYIIDEKFGYAILVLNEFIRRWTTEHIKYKDFNEMMQKYENFEDYYDQYRDNDTIDDSNREAEDGIDGLGQ